MNYTQEQIELWKTKAEKWDKLDSQISKCYCNKEGEYDEDDTDIEGADLCTVGEIAAAAFGWL